MKRKHIVFQIVISVILSLSCVAALVGCAGDRVGVPVVKDVTITAADGVSTGKAGALHYLSYNVPEGSKVATSVKKDNLTATTEDYSYLDNAYIFYTPGEFTITVYASKGGMLGKQSAKITVFDAGAFVSDVKLSAAAGEAYGKVGAIHVLSYNAPADCEIEVDIKKGTEAATDVKYDEQSGAVIFGTQGNYTVTVTAKAGEAHDSASALIEISPFDAPSVTLTLDKSEVKEDEEVTLNHSVTYDKGDEKKEESVTALYRARSSGEFTEAASGSYTVTGDRFMPHLSGEWKVVYNAVSKSGAESEASETLKCTPADITLSLATEAVQRIQTDKATDISYHVSGAADKYNVTFDTHGNSNVSVEKGDGYSARVTAATVDCFTVTVVYTHKVNTAVKKTLDIEAYSVESLTYAPVFGADPFDGMPSDVLTSMGHLLYFDARPGIGGHTLTARDAEYEVVEHNVTAASGGSGVEILYAANNEAYPYLIVTNFDHNVAQGDFTLKMTLTDPYSGYSAVATKKFNVIPTTNNNSTAANKIQSFVAEHPEFYDMSSMNFTNLCSDCRHNMVLTKTGTIMQRSNPSWTLNNNNADFAHMDFKTASKNNRLEFKFHLLAPNPTSGEVWLGIGMRTVTQNGWVGFFDLHIVNGRLDITNGLGTPKSETVNSGAVRALANDETTLYVRIDRRINGSLAEYTVYVKTTESGVYEQYYRATYNVSSSAGNAGSPVAQYQFTHRNAGGCYAVEDVHVTNYDA